MLWESSLTFNDIVTSAGWEVETLTPVRRLGAKLGAEAPIVYDPSVRESTENLPSSSVAMTLGAPPASLRMDTTARGIGLAATSVTMPLIEPVLCAWRAIEEVSNMQTPSACMRRLRVFIGCRGDQMIPMRRLRLNYKQVINR